jgi:hypothetical protein
VGQVPLTEATLAPLLHHDLRFEAVLAS